MCSVGRSISATSMPAPVTAANRSSRLCYYNLHRLGIFFTPSPRFADLLLVTGPVTRQMEEPLMSAYEAMAEPKFVVAADTCACSGGIFPPTAFTLDGVDRALPVDVYIPSCPPPPVALMQGLLIAIGRREPKIRAPAR